MNVCSRIQFKVLKSILMCCQKNTNFMFASKTECDLRSVSLSNSVRKYKIVYDVRTYTHVYLSGECSIYRWLLHVFALLVWFSPFAVILLQACGHQNVPNGLTS